MEAGIETVYQDLALVDTMSAYQNVYLGREELSKHPIARLQLGSAARATGFGLEFQVYAALMIGGYSILRGGVGNPIAEQTGETVNVNALGNLTGVCIDKVRGKEGMQLDLLIGSRGPLYCGGAGKAMLAWLSPGDQARVFDLPMEPLTVHTIIDPEVLRQKVERIRQRGYSVDDQEVVMGVYCVAVPIFDRHNRPVGAISITGPSVKRPGPELQPLVNLLNEVCGHVSRRLGYGGVWPPGEPGQADRDRRRGRQLLYRRAAPWRFGDDAVLQPACGFRRGLGSFPRRGCGQGATGF